MTTPFDAPVARIDLSRIVANYRMLQQRFTGRECAAVVKANAYGLGVEPVSLALSDAGCVTFFVATLEEGIELRGILPTARIGIFHGVGHGEALAFVAHRLVPVLNSPEQMARWRDVAAENREAVSILHIDTAMARLGLTPREWQAVLDEPHIVEACRVSLIMSHLACASEPEHASNAKQLAAFSEARRIFSDIPASLVNSAGIYLDRSFHFDLARPGCSLYGIAPQDGMTNPMQQVVELSAPILQRRVIDEPQAIGYGATQIVPAGTVIATVALGYADGFHRIATGRGKGVIGGTSVPILGRVTMDMISCDVTAVPEHLTRDGARITFLGDALPVDEVAASMQTIGYEVLTGLGQRVHRVYEGGAA